MTASRHTHTHTHARTHSNNNIVIQQSPIHIYTQGVEGVCGVVHCYNVKSQPIHTREYTRREKLPDRPLSPPAWRHHTGIKGARPMTTVKSHLVRSTLVIESSRALSDINQNSTIARFNISATYMYLQALVSSMLACTGNPHTT